jgi:hypothetical protein
MDTFGSKFLASSPPCCMTVASRSDANHELAARTGQHVFDLGSQAGRAAMGYLLGRISRNRSWPIARLLISALVRHHGEANSGHSHAVTASTAEAVSSAWRGPPQGALRRS